MELVKGKTIKFYAQVLEKIDYTTYLSVIPTC